MNRQNFNQLGGFPIETDNFDWMQNAYDIFNQLGYIAGNKSIISGCAVAGSTTADGYVFLNGELFKFVGGTTQATVRILETETSKEFENGDTNIVHTERYITFASGAGAVNWSEFKRIDSLLNLQSRILPPGTNPQLFSGNVASLPDGWHFCDGGTYNGITVPDLRGRFIVGYNTDDFDYNAIGKVGGEKQVALTGANNGPHTHTYTTENSRGSGSPGAEDGTGGIDTKTTSSSGTGTPHENRPPYYTLAYIIYTG